jgi:hypothetical protein
VTAVAALVLVAPPPKLPCPTHVPTLPANCWWCVGSVASGQYEQGGVAMLAVPGSIEVTVVLGDMVCLGLWGQLGCVLYPGTTAGE